MSMVKLVVFIQILCSVKCSENVSGMTVCYYRTIIWLDISTVGQNSYHYFKLQAQKSKHSNRLTVLTMPNASPVPWGPLCVCVFVSLSPSTTSNSLIKWPLQLIFMFYRSLITHSFKSGVLKHDILQNMLDCGLLRPGLDNTNLVSSTVYGGEKKKVTVKGSHSGFV